MSGAIEYYNAMSLDSDSVRFIRKFRNADNEIVLIFRHKGKTILYNIHSGYISCSDGSTYHAPLDDDHIKQAETGHRDYPPEFHNIKREGFNANSKHTRVFSSANENPQ